MLDQVETHHGLEHRNVHHAAFAGAAALQQGRQDGVRRHMAAGLVGGNRGQVAGLAALALHQVRQARHALDHIVIRRPPGIGPGQKAQQIGIDQLGLALAQRFGRNAQRRQFLRAHAVHEHIGAVHQGQECLLRGGLLQVQHHALLVAVGAHEHRRHARLVPRAGVAGGIALGRLDLDHLGPVVGQHLAGQRPKNHARQVEHTDALQGEHGRLVSRDGMFRRLLAGVIALSNTSLCFCDCRCVSKAG